MKHKVFSSLQDHVNGSIGRVTFHHEETGFCVLRVKVKGQRDLTTLVGTVMAELSFLEMLIIHLHLSNQVVELSY